MSKSTIAQELRIIESQLSTTAGHLEGLANNGMNWSGPTGDELRDRFRAALRENAARVRELAARVRLD